MFKPKTYLMVMVSGLLILTLGACSQAAPASDLTGNLKVYVTDAPPGKQVTSIMVTVSEVQVHLAAPVLSQVHEESASDNQSNSDNLTSSENQTTEEEQESQGIWKTIELSDNATTFDLLKIQGVEQFLGAGNITAGKYTQVRLVIAKIQVALGDGELQDARVPSNELKIVSPFEVSAGETAALVLDFEADKMVTVTGNGEIIVKPVVKMTVKHEKTWGQPDNTEEAAILENNPAAAVIR